MSFNLYFFKTNELNIYMPPNYKRIYQRTVDFYNKNKIFTSGHYDETFFTMRVFETAKQIIQLAGKEIDEDSILLAAILHDIGKIGLNTRILEARKHPSSMSKDVRADWKNEWKKHPALSIPLAKEIMTEEDLSEDVIEKVCFLIENHDNRELEEPSLELQILQDADYIADIGLTGFIRTFLFSGEFRVPTIDEIRAQKKNVRFQNLDSINLEESNQLAQTQIDRQNSLQREAMDLLDSELL
jgi:HD superfamily phosphodiesterase